ncbi:hypothetical protein [Brumimicrobium oceani]|uniref:Lipocalin-like domain-containing protein n=1 Tax=Brumimicrobium oceani TaxID=2100725 RepID=A0A2U2XGU0_9FLAO|nr:hypothetical protein [Brumimicrobium oceani]PWH86983.1 hypothetical protein DIT68_01615 [Brumimicrobium oceani]
MKGANIFLIGISTILTFSLFTSCKKNDRFDNYEQLTNKEWNITEVQNEQGNSIISECEKDDIILFGEDAFTLNEGNNVCDEGLIFKSGKWEFKDDGNGLKIKKVMKSNSGMVNARLVERFEILKLSDVELVLKSEEEDKIFYYE